MTCYKCGKKGRISPNCPDKTGGKATPSSGKAIEAWRMVAPKDGEPLTKTVDGVIAKWCGKFQKGKGMWHLGNKAHLEAQHKLVKQIKAEEKKAKESGNLAVMDKPEVEEQINSVEEEPLEVNFG